MGKEATIGLAVITVLLIAFGVVLVSRLGGSEEPAAAESPEQTGTNSAPGGEETDTDGAEGAVPEADELTVGRFVAKPAASQVPESAPPAIDEFDVAYGGTGKATGMNGGPGQVPPPLQPIPTVPPGVGFQPGRNGSLQPADASLPGQLQHAGTALAVADNQPFDDFEDQRRQNATTVPIVEEHGPDAARVPIGPTAGGLRSLGPPRQTSAQWGGRRDANYPSGESGPEGPDAAPMPAWRQTAPDPYPTPPRHTQPAPGPKSHSSLNSPYEARDLRNENGEYTVEPNDSYWVISQKLYGSGAYFKALAEHNRHKVPRENRLDVGDVIAAPSIPELEKAFPDLCPRPSRRDAVRNRAALASTRTPYVGGRIYVVEEGDTLFDIARYELGKASRWIEILRLNRDLVGEDAHYITPGMRLVLPDDEPTERVTQRPRPFYQP